MRVLSIASTKGGVGKTTLTVHLAVAAWAAGEATLVLDLDQQGSAVQWWKDRQRTFAERGLKKGASFEVRRASADHLPEILEEAEGQGFGLVVIDTPPHADFPAARAIEVADLVLMPSRPGYFDLHAAKATIVLVNDMKKPAFFVMNQVLHNSLVTGDDASKFLEAKGIKKGPLHLTLLQLYVRALRDGLTAPEVEPEGRHAGEIGDLWRWTNAQLGIACAGRNRQPTRQPARARGTRRAPSPTAILGDPLAGLELPKFDEDAA